MHQKSIELLNNAVADELFAVHQYMYFHFHCDDQGLDLLAGLFKRTAIEEMVHIERLAERILFLKGEVLLTAADEVEKIGIQLAEQKLSEADLSLIIVDQSRPLDQIDFDIIERSKSTLCIVIINKIDLPKMLDEEELKYHTKDIPIIRISAKSGEGLDFHPHPSCSESFLFKRFAYC